MDDEVERQVVPLDAETPVALQGRLTEDREEVALRIAGRAVGPLFSNSRRIPSSDMIVVALS